MRINHHTFYRTSQYLMGSVNIFKPVSTSLLPVPPINLSNIFWGEHQEPNPGLLIEKQECYLFAAVL